MIRKTCRWLALVAGLAAPVALAAQERTTVTGVVRGPGGDPVASAQVSVVGTNTGALTDASGAYRMVVTGSGRAVTLRAAKIGHASSQATVTLNGASVTQNFTLAEQVLALDAVVVTGSPAGNATRREVPNVVSQIQTAQVVDQVPAIQNVNAVLQSRVPGLQVMTQGGTEGTSARVRIRGVSSISGGSAPIYVIDGVRMFGGTLSGFGLSGATQSASDAIHPMDIESIEVIKGPAAATLYGADAANGVISITSKKGRPGQQRVSFTGRANYGEQEWAARTFTNYSLCTPARIADAAGWPGCQGAAPNSLISANLLRDDPKALRTGQTRTYHLSATGGGERFGFFLSGNLDDNAGIVFNNEFQRISGRSNFTFVPSDRFDANVNVGYYRTNTQLPLSDNASDGLTRNANRAVVGRQNAWGVSWLGLTPTEINEFDDRTVADRFIFSSTMRYNPTSWFQNRVAGGFDFSTRNNTRFYRVQPAGRAPYGAVNATGTINEFAPDSRLYTLDYSGTVLADVRSDLSSESSFGAQLIANRGASLQGYGEGLPSNTVRLISFASTTQAFQGLSEQTTVGFFVQQKLGWRNRLFITGGLRADDNSAFGEDFTFVFYPKLGASWVVSEEPFFRLPNVDQFRLRAAWGRAGNAPAPYSADRTFASTQVVNADLSARPALVAANYGNPELRAEQGEELELGFDGSLFNGRVALDFTYYDKKTREALVPVPAAPSSGFTGNVLQNAGQITNRGTELTLSVLPIETENFTWESRVAHSTLTNRLDSFGGVRDDSEPIYTGFNVANGGLRITPGAPLPQFFGTVPSRDPATGALLRNPNGTLVVDRDTVYFGGSLPTRTISWDNNFRAFRNLRFGFQLDHQGGHYQINLTRRTRANDRVSREAILVPGVSTLADTAANELLLSGAFAQYIERADFVKLREVSASYTLPTRFTRGIGSDAVVVSLSGRNLMTWTDYGGVDPEVNAENSDFTLAETNAIPPTRRVTASITVRF
jgi:TonB-linked SusC/RagA family outer membrane protein